MNAYQTLALNWFPGGKTDRLLVTLVALSVVSFLALAIIVDNIDLPEKERRAQRIVPERIAKFISEKPKPKVTPQPTATPEPPKPISTPKPTVQRRPDRVVDKPISKEQQKARDKAAESGLLALSAELNDLLDTSSIDTSVKIKTRKGKNTQSVKEIDTSAIDSGAVANSGGVSGDTYGERIVAQTKLDQRQIDVLTSAVGQTVKKDQSVAKNTKRERSDKFRPEEEIVIVFDQNKAALYSLYNRERRKKPGLKGKIVVELTIAPSGSVLKARIVSSELNSPTLERRLLARIKTFKFGEMNVEPVTVTFPVEFLPS